MCVTASCVSERCAAILSEIIQPFVPPNVYIINDYQLSSRAAGRPGGAGGGGGERKINLERPGRVRGRSLVVRLLYTVQQGGEGERAWSKLLLLIKT